MQEKFVYPEKKYINIFFPVLYEMSASEFFFEKSMSKAVQGEIFLIR